MRNKFFEEVVMEYFLLQAKGFLFFFATVGILSHIIGESLPRKRFHYDAWPYKPYAWEEDGMFYNRVLRIRKWRKYLPDKSKAVKSMYRKSLGTRFSESHVERLIQESCVAEFVHLMLILSSPFIAAFMDGRAALFCGIAFAVGNVPFVLIQRYNRPKLIKLYRAAQEKKNDENACKENDVVCQNDF